MKNKLPLKIKITHICSTVFILIFVLFAGYVCFKEGWSKCQTADVFVTENGGAVYRFVFDKITPPSIPYFVCVLILLAVLSFLILRAIRPSKATVILCAASALVAILFYLSLNTDLSSMVFFMGILDNTPIIRPLALSAKYIVTTPVLLAETLHLIFFLCHFPKEKEAEAVEITQNCMPKNDL